MHIYISCRPLTQRWSTMCVCVAVRRKYAASCQPKFAVRTIVCKWREDLAIHERNRSVDKVPKWKQSYRASVARQTSEHWPIFQTASGHGKSWLSRQSARLNRYCAEMYETAAESALWKYLPIDLRCDEQRECLPTIQGFRLMFFRTENFTRASSDRKNVGCHVWIVRTMEFCESLSSAHSSSSPYWKLGIALYIECGNRSAQIDADDVTPFYYYRISRNTTIDAGTHSFLFMT